MACGLVFRGLGTVGSALLRLLSDMEGRLRAETGIPLVPLALIDSRGHSFAEGSWRMAADAIVSKETSGALSGGHPTIADLRAMAADAGVDRIVVLDATPSDYLRSEPATGALESFLSEGLDVVTACKSPLATSWERIERARATGGGRLGFTATTGLTFPGVSHLRRAMTGARLTGIEAVANGTSAYILGCIGEGRSFDEALSQAQAQGIAEPDPTLDVDGWDTAAKLSILHSALSGEALGIMDVDRRGIRDVTPDDAMAARINGSSIKLVGRSGGDGSSVAPEALAPGHPLHGLQGTGKGFVFETDMHGSMCVSGGRSGVRTTAAVMISDLVDVLLYRV